MVSLTTYPIAPPHQVQRGCERRSAGVRNTTLFRERHPIHEVPGESGIVSFREQWTPGIGYTSYTNVVWVHDV